MASPDPRAEVERIHLLLSSYRLTVSSELAMQASIEQVLTKAGVNFVREHRLGRGPIDFYLPNSRIGIEAKISGSPSAVAKQVLDYLEDEQIAGLVLISRKRSHFIEPEDTLGKPLSTVWIGGSSL